MDKVSQVSKTAITRQHGPQLCMFGKWKLFAVPQIIMGISARVVGNVGSSIRADVGGGQSSFLPDDRT